MEAIESDAVVVAEPSLESSYLLRTSRFLNALVVWKPADSICESSSNGLFRPYESIAVSSGAILQPQALCFLPLHFSGKALKQCLCFTLPLEIQVLRSKIYMAGTFK